MPELQGRLPIRVELKRADARGLAPHPDRAGGEPHQAVRGADGDRAVDAQTSTDDAIDALADAAVQVNSTVENIGARRLQTVMERVLDEISFDASDRRGEGLVIDAAYVNARIGDLAKNADLSKFIL